MVGRLRTRSGAAQYDLARAVPVASKRPERTLRSFCFRSSPPPSRRSDRGPGQSAGRPLRGSVLVQSRVDVRVYAHINVRFYCGCHSEDAPPPSLVWLDAVTGWSNLKRKRPSVRPCSKSGLQSAAIVRALRKSCGTSPTRRRDFPWCAVADLRGRGGVSSQAALQSERVEKTRDRAERGSALRGFDQASVAAEEDTPPRPQQRCQRSAS
jgi:hypothetical protein